MCPEEQEINSFLLQSRFEGGLPKWVLEQPEDVGDVTTTNAFQSTPRIFEVAAETVQLISHTLSVPTYPENRTYKVTQQIFENMGVMGVMYLRIDLPFVNNPGNEGNCFFGDFGAIAFINSIEVSMANQNNRVVYTASDIYNLVAATVDRYKGKRWLYRMGITGALWTSKLLDKSHQFVIPLPTPWFLPNAMMGMGMNGYGKMEFFKQVDVQITFAVMSEVIFNNDPLTKVNPDHFTPMFALQYEHYPIQLDMQRLAQDPITPAFYMEKYEVTSPNIILAGKPFQLDADIGTGFTRVSKFMLIYVQGTTDMANDKGMTARYYPILSYEINKAGGSSQLLKLDDEVLCEVMGEKSVGYEWFEKYLYVIPWCITTDLDVMGGGELDFQTHRNVQLSITATNRSGVDQKFKLVVMSITRAVIAYDVATKTIRFG